MSWATIASMLTRGKVTSATIAQRTVLQLTGLDNESFEDVELLLPPGYVARPAEGADIAIHQMNGSRDHKVALGGDMAGEVQADLDFGERGMVGFGCRIIFRQGYLEIVCPLPLKLSSTQEILMDAPDISAGAAGETAQKVCLQAFFEWAATHTHPGTGAPSTSPPATGLSTNFGAT